MKKTMFALAAVAALAGTAAVAETTVALSYGQDFTAAGFGETTTNSLGVSVARDFGAYNVGVAFSGDEDAQNLEATIGRHFALNDRVSVGGALGVGQRFDANDFAYYTVSADADVKVTDKLSWTAVDYRYRNAFDTDNDYESHRVGTGVSYALTDTVAVNASVYRNFDGDFDATGNAASLGLAYKF